MSTFATPSPSKISRYSRYGSWQVLAEAQFQRGIVTDTAPVALPAGAVVDARDYLFDRPGKIRKRGGSAYASPALGDATSVAHVSYVPFSAGEKLIAVTSNAAGSFHTWDATGTPVDLGAYGSPFSNPAVFYNDHLYLITGGSGLIGRPGVVANSGGTCSAFNSVAPISTIGCAHGGYLVLANDNNTMRNRLWFSPIPNPEVAWDMSNAYIDTNGPITGLASVQGVLVVFHANSCERILGSIPPGTVGENMSLQPLSGQAGTIDPASIRTIGGNVYFADSSAVWVTNGASVTSVTSRADGTGVSSLWRTTITAVYHAPDRAVRAGTFGNDYYIVQILRNDGAWTSALSLVYHIATGVWSRLTIEPFSDFSPASRGLETAAAPVNQGRVIALSDLFAETPANPADADGTPVLPRVQSRVMGTGPFEKAFGDGHLTYDIRTTGGGPPALNLYLSKDIEQQTFAAAFNFSPVTGPTRQRFPISGDGHGLSWLITQNNPSAKTELYAVEVEHRNYEEQADG